MLPKSFARVGQKSYLKNSFVILFCFVFYLFFASAIGARGFPERVEQFFVISGDSRVSQKFLIGTKEGLFLQEFDLQKKRKGSAGPKKNTDFRINRKPIFVSPSCFATYQVLESGWIFPSQSGTCPRTTKPSVPEGGGGYAYHLWSQRRLALPESKVVVRLQAIDKQAERLLRIRDDGMAFFYKRKGFRQRSPAEVPNKNFAGVWESALQQGKLRSKASERPPASFAPSFVLQRKIRIQGMRIGSSLLLIAVDPHLRFAAIWDWKDYYLQIHDLARGKLLHKSDYYLPQASRGRHVLAFSPDGTSYFDGRRIRALANGEVLANIPRPPCSLLKQARFSKDGQYLALLLEKCEDPIFAKGPSLFSSLGLCRAKTQKSGRPKSQIEIYFLGKRRQTRGPVPLLQPFLVRSLKRRILAFAFGGKINRGNTNRLFLLEEGGKIRLLTPSR